MSMWSFSKRKCIGIAAATAATTAIFASAPAYAAQQPIWLEVNQGYYLNTGGALDRVAVATPEIADVCVVGPSALNVIAKKAGTTSLTVWTKNGMRQEFLISVSPADSGLAQMIQRAIGLPKVRVEKIGENIVLKGTVQNQRERQNAVRTAASYLGKYQLKDVKDKERHFMGGDGKDAKVDDSEEEYEGVVNLLQVINPDQINIEAMIIEVNAKDAEKLGATYTSRIMSDDSDKGIKLNNPGEFFAGESTGIQRGSGNHWYNRNWLYTHFSQINAQIHALIEDNKARIVSRPNITTMSGKSAGIHVGGTLLIPIQGVAGAQGTLEKYPYGIELNLTNPVVDDEGNITTSIYTSVSTIDWANAIGSVPSVKQRAATTVVNIPSGMTMVIGGLMNSDEGKTIQKVPLLGNIPIIGELFKYSNKTNQKSEIMVLLTPRIVNETTPTKMSKNMQDALNDARREKRDLPEVDVNGVIPKSEAELKAEAKQKKEAELKAKQEAEAKQKAEAELREKQKEEAERQAEAELKAKQQAEKERQAALKKQAEEKKKAISVEVKK